MHINTITLPKIYLMIIHSLKRLEMPSSIPIGVLETKNYLKIDYDLDDTLIEDMIKAAANTFEDVTSSALTPQIWRVVYKNLDSNIIDLPITPVIKIINVSSINGNTKKELLNYGIIQDSLVLNAMYDSDLLLVDFEAGTDSKVNFIPSNIKLTLLEHVAFLYENRGEQKHFDQNIYLKFRSIKY